MMPLIHELLAGETGVTTVEYALLLALIVVVATVAWDNLGCGVTRTVWYTNHALRPR